LLGWGKEEEEEEEEEEVRPTFLPVGLSGKVLKPLCTKGTERERGGGG